MNTIKITCQIGTTNAQDKLGLEAWVDDEKFYDTDHVQEDTGIEVEINDDDAEHDLKFVLKNKKPEHTAIDADGNIVKDTCVYIKDLKFDEIELGYMFTKLATYSHDFNGTGQITNDQFFGTMGCNGTVTLKFNTPIYLWLLENM